MRTAQSQNLIIDDSTSYKKGLYKTFEEFKTNSPSIPLTQEVISSNVVWTDVLHLVMYGLKNNPVYYLKIEKEETKKIGFIWGFCDGKNVYVNREFNTFSGKLVFNPQSKFFKMLYFGRYCYFITGQQTPLGFSPGAIGLDINSGNIFELTSSKTKKIISKDKELLNEYNNDLSKEDLNFKYLKLYSEKHKDEIKRK
jgi:hypothetical protein